MKFKIGDRVSFLDDKGGGIVTKIVDENIVHVSIEEGFEIPTSVSDLILTSPAGTNMPKGNDHESVIEQDDISQNDENISPLNIIESNDDISGEGIYFAIVPESQDTPLARNLILYLINHTDYQILYSLFTNESGLFYGFDFGYLEPQSKVLLENIGRAKIENWVNALVQVVFFAEGKTTILNPISQFINFKPVKTYKEDAFKHYDIIDSKAILIELGLTKDQTVNPYMPKPVSADNMQILKEKLTLEEKPKDENKKAKTFLDKHKIDEKIAEVDLHIHNLIDDFTNYSNYDLINIQVDYFQRCIEQAIKDKLLKVIFIHGVGEGVLKDEIIKHLKKTEGIQYYDAPYSRYGMGATEVFFFRNK